MARTCGIWMCGLSLAAIACSREPADAAPASAMSSGAEIAPAKKRSTLQGHMDASFELALKVRDAVIDGDLQSAQQQANELALQDYRGVLPEHWMPGLDKMQREARAVAQSTTLEHAAGHVASLAASCGECHSRFETDADETELHHGFSAKGTEDLQTRMLRHQRAADGLWFGLTIPSAAAWRGGARALTEAPEGPITVEGQEADPQLEAAMESLLALGRRALAAEGVDEQVAVYGEMLARCSKCHET